MRGLDELRAYRREYMRKRRADPAFRAAEYARNNELDKRPEARVKHAEQQRTRSYLRKLEAVKYLGDRCLDCNQEWPLAVFEFHHLDPTQKESDGSYFLQGTKAKMYLELDKCVLLCANCHRIRHHV